MTELTREEQQSLTVVVPAFNEEGAIERVLSGLHAALPHCDIVVVDDGSDDGTLAKAESVPGVRVLSNIHNMGYGASVKVGMLSADRELVAWFDADGEHRVEDLVRLARRALDEPGLAAAIGRRPRGASWVRNVGKFVIWLSARSLWLKLGDDVNCGLRVFRRRAISPFIPLLPDGFSASMTSTLLLAEFGYPIDMVPIEQSERIGRSKVALSDGLAALFLTLRLVMLLAPMRVFLTLGGVPLAVGLLYSFYVAMTRQQGFPVAGMVMILAGLMFIGLGLVADQISRLRLTPVEMGRADWSVRPKRSAASADRPPTPPDRPD